MRSVPKRWSGLSGLDEVQSRDGSARLTRSEDERTKWRGLRNADE